MTTGKPEGRCERRLTSARPRGSSHSSPTGYTTLISAASCTGTSSLRISLGELGRRSAVCCSISIWLEPSTKTLDRRHDRRDGGVHVARAPPRLGRPHARAIHRVDRRSDIYSLGMVLIELITGHRPFEQSGSYSVIPAQIEAMARERSESAPSLKSGRQDISWGMESISRKCLAPDPARRYQRADQLADDLRRLLEDRPLRYAPELSRVEQARKFIRRHPRLASSSTAAGIAALVLLVGSLTALAGVRNQLAGHPARAKRCDRIKTGVQQAQCLINTRLDLHDNLREGIAACERTLALFGAPDDDAWELSADWLRIRPLERQRLAEDRRELLLLLAGARVRLAGESREAARQALLLLDRAEAIKGLSPSRALWLDRARYFSLCGQKEQALEAGRRARQTPAETARDHYLLATSLIQQGGPEAQKAALTELDLALQRNPGHYWSLVQRGICRLERGELASAAADFGQCVGIWPEFAWGYFNRGCVFDRTGNKVAAVLDFSAAIEPRSRSGAGLRQPRLGPAGAFAACESAC